MAEYTPGDRVTVVTKGGAEFTGTVLPGEGLTLKLDDGYNLGIDQRNLESIQKVEGEAKSKKQAPKVKKDESLPKISLIHTGGTIASKVDYETGAVTNLATPEELLAQYPELLDIANVDAVLAANMSSDDMRFSHYNLILDEVEKAHKTKPAGIIITQGTDTLHYTAAALHYALQGIDLPVVIVGSQRSSDRGSSDAATNLLGAARFITELGTPGVFIAMHESSDDESIAILHGVNVRKMHTSRRDAFRPVNVPQVARVTGDGAELLYEPERPQTDLSITRFDEKLRIGMLYAHPHMHPEQFTTYKDFDGLILIGTGLGHMPINMYDDLTKVHEEHRNALKELADKMPVMMTSQCINGRINMQVYSAGRKHLDLGVLGQDLALTPESAFCKLAHILSAGLDPKKALAQDMGDAIPRTEEGTYE